MPTPPSQSPPFSPDSDDASLAIGGVVRVDVGIQGHEHVAAAHPRRIEGHAHSRLTRQTHSPKFGCQNVAHHSTHANRPFHGQATKSIACRTRCAATRRDPASTHSPARYFSVVPTWRSETTVCTRVAPNWLAESDQSGTAARLSSRPPASAAIVRNCPISVIRKR